MRKRCGSEWITRFLWFTQGSRMEGCSAAAVTVQIFIVIFIIIALEEIGDQLYEDFSASFGDQGYKYGERQ